MTVEPVDDVEAARDLAKAIMAIVLRTWRESELIGVCAEHLERHREQARAEAIEQAQADDGWLPIEQAPRDGTRILVAKIGWIFKDVVEAFKDGHEPAEQGWHLYFATTAYYAADKGYWTDGLEKLVEPTHWRSVGPLPAPPRSSPLPLGGSGGVRGG
jgi:hypothetical protein